MIIDKLIERAKINKKTICLPETDDIRTLQAANIVKEKDFANLILIGNEIEIQELAKENNLDLNNIKIINPKTSELTNELINKFYELRKHKGISLEDAKDIITNNPLYFGSMLVYLDYADGMVAGANHSSADVLRSALQTVKTKNKDDLVSAFFLMELPKKEMGYNGTLIFSDCGLNQNPTSEELVKIAYSSSDTIKKLLDIDPKIAFLSHSSNNSSNCDDVKKVQIATKLFKEQYPNILADGEMQIDVAICKEVQVRKCPNSLIKGDANILIFPDLDAGNIAYKTAERIGDAKAYGPVTQGLKKPINDLSRGCKSTDIVGVIAITCLQANE